MTKLFPLASNRASLAVTETGGHLSDVTFSLPGGRKISPMHIAPWIGEAMPADAPPFLAILRGDFFCPPFGGNDVVPAETRVNGLTANGTWRLTNNSPAGLDAVLDGDVMGAKLTKHVEVRPGEAMVYQRHTFTGGSGRLPIGHRAMLRANSPLRLAFSPWTKALTHPAPVEVPPHGRALRAPNQTITDLKAAKRDVGGTVDLTIYPTPDGYETIWMLIADRAQPFAWTAATAAEDGWVWFALKDPRILPQTLLSHSNGGRDYPPWNGRHKRVIGLEEICGYFHFSHAEAISNNPVAASGSLTAVELRPGSDLNVSYAFGLAETPPGFGSVATIVEAPGGVKLVDVGDRETFAACDLSFVTGRKG